MITVQLTITPTDRFVAVEGAPCRIWRARSSLGAECLLFVRAITLADDIDEPEFDAVLDRDRVRVVVLPGASSGRPPDADKG